MTKLTLVKRIRLCLLGALLLPPMEVTTSLASVMAEAAPASSGTAPVAPADWLLLA